jgi:multidrug efflux system membrane fusion protein
MTRAPRLGHLDFVDNQLDGATGTIHGAVFRNGDGQLTPGLFVRLSCGRRIAAC